MRGVPRRGSWTAVPRALRPPFVGERFEIEGNTNATFAESLWCFHPPLASSVTPCISKNESLAKIGPACKTDPTS
jgi:hypothetical protein